MAIDTLYARINALVKEYEDHPWIKDLDEREAFYMRLYYLRRVLMLAYGDVDKSGALPASDSLPKPPEEAERFLKDLSDLSAHERASLYGLIRQRWDAWCKMLGGPAVAKAVEAAAGQINQWDHESRAESSSRDGTWSVGLRAQPIKRQGRPPAGAKTMTNAERQRRYRERRKTAQAEGVE